MRKLIRKSIGAAVGVITILVLMAGSSAQEPTKEKKLYIQAQAYGTSTQLGRTHGVNIIVNDYSTPEDQKVLLAAFKANKNEGLVDALQKMKAKGRIALVGGLGYDVVYIRKFARPDGTTMLRMVTDRLMTFGEVNANTRSMDYSLTGIEVILSPNEKKNKGTLLPACKFKIDKKGQLQLELLQNSWRLANVRVD